MASYHSSSGRGPRFRRLFVAFILIVSIVLFAADREQKSALSQGRAVSDTISGKVIHVLQAPLRGIDNMRQGLSERRNIRAENTRLRTELARLKDVEMRAIAMEGQLARFEKILDVDVTQAIPARKIAARAVSETNGPFTRSSLINSGTAKGLKSGDAVMSVSGLYGHITRAGRSSSRVLLVTDVNSRIPVKSAKGNNRAIMTGNNSDRPALDFLTDNHTWSDGDIVLTSGDEGVLQAGLPVGEIVSSDGQLYVTPYYLQEPVDWVWVYPFTPISAPIDDDSGTDAAPNPAEEAPSNAPPSDEQN